VINKSTPSPVSGGATSIVNLSFKNLWLNVGAIFIDQEENYIMDWMIRWAGGPAFRTLAFWNFKPTDLQTLCVRCKRFVP
jgi:hypothetical protein